MGQSPILSIIHSVTIGTLLSFNGGNNGHELENVTCKQILIQKLFTPARFFCSKVNVLKKILLYAQESQEKLFKIYHCDFFTTDKTPQM